MKKFEKVTWIIFIILFFCGSTLPLPGNLCRAASSEVNYTTFQANCTLANGNQKTLTIHTWCPQDTQNGPYPLVIFSHGYLFGSATQSKYITEGLAQQGYIVCATTYEDSIYYRGQKNSVPGYWDRPLEAKAIIDEILRLNNTPDSPFYGIVDENNIGVCGHSLGGWTSEALCGAVPPDYKVCMDNRVDAGVFYAPANVMTQEELTNAENIHVPTMFIFGEKDKGVTAEESRFVYDVADPPKYLAIVKGIRHMDFSNTGAKKAGAAATLEYTIAFFDRYLKDLNTDDILQTKHSSFVSYEYIVDTVTITLKYPLN
ncbi:MAG: dienelactone hydrolase family protein [Candidatus Omnitrophota bacterium]